MKKLMGIKPIKFKGFTRKPEVVDFVVNPKIGIGIVKECAQLGIENIWLQPGTVSEEILEFAKEKGINAVEACVLVALRTL